MAASPVGPTIVCVNTIADFWTAGRSGAMRELVSKTSTAESGSPAEVKGFDFLRDAVVEHVEIILLKVQDQFALGVVYSDRRVYQRDLQANRALRRLLHRRAWFGRDGSLRTLRARVLTGKQDRRDEHDKAS